LISNFFFQLVDRFMLLNLCLSVLVCNGYYFSSLTSEKMVLREAWSFEKCQLELDILLDWTVCGLSGQ